MAKIPAINRLIVEDFPGEQKWIGKLLNPINTFLSATVFALTRHLTFYDNLLGQEQLLDFNYNSAASLPVLFTVTMGATPVALYVVQATENLTTPIAVAVAWSITQSGQVQITSITKLYNGVASTLVVGARYQIRVRITP